MDVGPAVAAHAQLYELMQSTDHALDGPTIFAKAAAVRRAQGRADLAANRRDRVDQRDRRRRVVAGWRA